MVDATEVGRSGTMAWPGHGKMQPCTLLRRSFKSAPVVNVVHCTSNHLCEGWACREERGHEPVVSRWAPLIYSLTSITMDRRHFWPNWQSDYEYLERQHLFDEDVTAQAGVLGDDDDDDDESTGGFDMSSASLVSQDTVVNEEGLDGPVLKKVPDYPDYPPRPFNPRPVIVIQPPVETHIPDAVNNVPTHPTLHLTPYSFLFLSWMTPLLRLGSKRPLLESVVISVSD